MEAPDSMLCLIKQKIDRRCPPPSYKEMVFIVNYMDY